MSILLRIDFDVSKALYVPSTDQFTQLPSDAMIIRYEFKARRLAACSWVQLEIVSHNKVSSINSCFRQILTFTSVSLCLPDCHPQLCGMQVRQCCEEILTTFNRLGLIYLSSIHRAVLKKLAVSACCVWLGSKPLFTWWVLTRICTAEEACGQLAHTIYCSHIIST